jgi:NADH dehydrogenase
MRILITGATGFIGRRLLGRVVAQGHQAVALVRPHHPEGELVGPQVTVVRGFVTDPGALAQAVERCAAVVHLAAATGIADESMARAVNVEGTERLLYAARQAKVGRFVFISTISALRERMGPYGRTKRRGEELVSASGLPFVILRPSLVYGEGAVGLFATLARYLKSLPVVPVIGSGEIELDPVHLDDVCTVIEQCLTRDDVLGKSYDLLGPERVTFNEFLRRLAAEIGVSKPFVHIPGWFALLAASALGAMSKRPPLSVDNVLGLISPARVDRESAARDFPLEWIRLERGLKALAQA